MNNNKKRQRRSTSNGFELHPGDTGLMLTCFKGRENITSKELLNMISFESESIEENQLSENSQTFSDAIEKELESLGKAPSWSLVGMGDVKCIIFVKPNGKSKFSSMNIATSIWERVLTTGFKLSRYIIH